MSGRLDRAAPSSVVALAALLICSCGSTPPRSNATAPGSSTVRPSSTVGADNGETASPGSSASAGSTTSSQAPAPKGPTGTVPPANAGSAQPSPNGTLAAAGTYTYTVSGSSSGTDSIAIVNQSSGSTADEQATVTDQGNKTTTDETWSSASVLLNDVKSTSSMGSADCHFSKPITELLFPLGTGKSWQSDATCAVSQGAFSGTLHWTESDTVSGTTTVTVDGTAVACWTITRHITVEIHNNSAASPQPQPSTVTEVDAYSPSVGLPVRTTTSSGSTSRTLTLQHLHPS